MAIKTALKQIHIIINTLITKANAAIDKLFTLSFSIAIISYLQNKINLYSKRKHTHSSVFSF